MLLASSDSRAAAPDRPRLARRPVPRQSSDVQQLIAAISRQLAERARVTEWLLLPDRDGTPREVDVLVDVTTRSRPVRIAIEYGAGTRPVGVGWIEQLHGKYRDLPVDHVVAVAKGGFTPAARTTAAVRQIRLLTLAEARRADWARAFDDAARSPRAGPLMTSSRDADVPAA
ncbi:hypothetical protein tb265_24730 [Gemmatimonadetes bacterium T265]|nr:hypothetical protein tb265_24730 [Gemmatimonadetes bacterium T265]